MAKNTLFNIHIFVLRDLESTTKSKFSITGHRGWGNHMEHIKTHSLENNVEAGQSSCYDEHLGLLWRFQNWVTLTHTLLHWHAFSQSETAYSCHYESSPGRCHSVSCGHVEGLLSNTYADCPSQFTADEANRNTGVKSSVIHWRSSVLFTALCPVTQLKMDVH